MGLQQIFDKDPGQQFLDKFAYNEAKIFLAALKAAVGVANEVNAAETPPEPSPEDLKLEAEKAKAENGGAEPPADPEDPEPEDESLVTFEDALTVIAPAIYNQMTIKLAMAQAQAATAPAPSEVPATKPRRAISITSDPK